MDFEITPVKLYLIGMVSFFTISVTSIINYVIFWSLNNIWSKIGSAFSIIFNISMAFFFRYLLSLEPKIENVAQSDDIDEIIAALKGEKPRSVIMIDEGGKLKKKK